MVVHAIAEGDDPHVCTRFRWSKSAAAQVEALKALAPIDLAGALIEDDPKSAASVTDRDNALARCREIVEMQGPATPISFAAAWPDVPPL